METNNQFSRKYSAHLVAVLTFCTLLLISEYLFHLNYRHQKGIQLSDVFSHASALRQSIEREINTTLNLTSGLVLFVSINPDFSDNQFVSIARELLHKAPHLRNIALARDNIVTSVYPLQGNEKALGLRLLDIPEQKQAVLRAIEEKTSVIAGPVNLKQGGEGFISRVPIFLAGQQDKYWGLASLVINTEEFYRTCGLLPHDHEISFALRNKDPLGKDGTVFFGPESLFNDRDAVQLPIILPSGQWILSAKSKTSLTSTSSPLFLILRGFGIAVSLSVSGLVFALLSSYRRIQYLALHDPLTGLANRRLFFEHVKQAISSAVRNDGKFAIVYMDLDNFKPVNDTYGHKHGDQVLREIAVRVTEGLRHSDIIARIGGDEFILLMQDTKSSEDIPNLTEKVSRLISRPITLDNGVTIGIQASIGTSIFPEDGTTADDLIRHADRKMYTAKYANRR